MGTGDVQKRGLLNEVVGSVSESVIITHRWLMMKGRTHEALLVLSRVNHNSSKETTVDTLIELEQLKSSIAVDSSWRQFYGVFKQWKYRYNNCDIC